jgi:hypothetical protein
MTIDRTRYELEVDERFEADTLDERLWLRHYLPHWSSREASAARFDVGGGELRLRIDADQRPWNPEHDGWLRVSSLQTGEFAGPPGSDVGQLQFAQGLTVREEQPATALYTPRYGLFEIRLRGIPDPANMIALWMIGYEDAPDRSGEILICEVFGQEMSAESARIGMGIRPWADPALSDEFEFVPIDIDAREPHWYAAEWTPDCVAFYVDEQLVKVAEQSPSYPMQFMLSLYEFADGPEPPSPPESYPKVAVVERFRAWRPVSGPGARPPTGPSVARDVGRTVSRGPAAS